MKEKITAALARELQDLLSCEDIEKAIEIPPSDNLGDYAFPCFGLAKTLKKSPVQIASQLKEKLLTLEGIRVETTGGYLNFFVDKEQLAASVINLSSQETFGKQNKEQRVVIEFASPNTNKPLHLGHLRNMSIGDSVSRILSFCGCDVTKTSINNDRGVHICKSMLAYQRKGNGATPESSGIKSDHFVGDYYVLFNNESK
ncbi:MAG: arginine--tRNA ligase, partial [Chitinispirillales bacterium]|nr:arginine--tRNA ligase [Chitinispirillales bacterium]